MKYLNTQILKIYFLFLSKIKLSPLYQKTFLKYFFNLIATQSKENAFYLFPFGINYKSKLKFRWLDRMVETYYKNV